MKKLLIFIIFILLLGVVNADKNWYSWGNMGYTSSVFDDAVLFGSNYNGGTTDLTEHIIPVDISKPPVVADLDGSGSNEIITINGKTLTVYSSSLELIGTVVHTNLISNPVILNYDTDSDPEVVVCEDTDIMIYDLVGGELTLVKEWANKCGDIGADTIYADSRLDFDNFDIGDELFTVFRRDTSPQTIRVSRTNIKNGSYHGGQTSIGSNEQRCSDDFGNSFFVDDINNDNIPEYAIITTGATQTHISAITIDTNNVIINKVLNGNTARNDSCNLGFSQIGLNGGFKELVAGFYDTTLNASNSYIVNRNGVIVSSFGTTGSNQSFTPVANYNGDAYNNIALGTGLAIVYRDSLYNTELTVNLTDVYDDSLHNNYFSIGEYNDDLDYQEILTRKGIFEIQNVVGSSGELHQIYEFNGAFDSINTQVYPVSLQEVGRFNKDILVYEEDLLAVYLGGTTTTCGDGLCESGENVYNCCSDCCGLTSDVRVTEWKICPSPEYSIINGTDIEVTFKVESNTDSELESRAIFYQGDSNQYDTGWLRVFGTQSVTTLSRIANKTGILRLALQGRNFPDTSIIDQQIFELPIHATEGITLEHGICLTGTNTLNPPALNETAGHYATNSPCSLNSECASGFCSGGKCHLKYESSTCSLSSECLSGQCLNSRCTETTLYENVEILKNDAFGDDTATNNIISIVAILIMMLGIVLVFGSYVHDAKILAYLGLGVSMMGIIFFTFIGWMSPFFLIGIIILALVIFVVSHFTKSGGD